VLGVGSSTPTDFDLDTAVHRRTGESDASENLAAATFDAEASPDWMGPTAAHGGYVGALLLRALAETLQHPTYEPRSLSIDYAKPAAPGPVKIQTAVERSGRRLDTISGRMEQNGSLVALALGVFSPTVAAPEISELQMPDVPPPNPARAFEPPELSMGPPFMRQLVVQFRIGAAPFTSSEAPLELGAWLGFAERRPLDALSLTVLSDALFPPVFIRFAKPTEASTVNHTIYFRRRLPRVEKPDHVELCFGRFRSTVMHEGFVEEDGVIWAPDSTVLCQSRQLTMLT
jgi:acyl-coenzyme A thioesterase PaaI-like protein